MLGFRVNGQERCFWCKKVVLLKHRVRTPGQKELHWGCEEQLIIYYGVGGGKEKRRFSKDLSYAKEDLQDSGGLAIVKLGLFSPLARY